MSNENNYDLSFFMPNKLKEAEVTETEKIISKRIKDKSGNPIPFIFKPITTERVDEIEEDCTYTLKNSKGRVVGSKVDQKRFMPRIAVESTLYPDFKSEELRKAYQTEDALEIAKKVLNVAGEYAEWMAEAIKINGFDEPDEDLEEAVKN